MRVRLAPLGIAVLLLLVGLGREEAPSRSAAVMAAGLAVVAFAALLHVLALRFPRRLALDGTAWAVTLVTVLLAVGLGFGPSLR